MYASRWNAFLQNLEQNMLTETEEGQRTYKEIQSKLQEVRTNSVRRHNNLSCILDCADAIGAGDAQWCVKLRQNADEVENCTVFVSNAFRDCQVACKI